MHFVVFRKSGPPFREPFNMPKNTPTPRPAATPSAWPRRLPAQTIDAIKAEGRAAHEAGWTRHSIDQHLATLGVDRPVLRAALAGYPIDPESYGVLAMISIIGFVNPPSGVRGGAK